MVMKMIVSILFEALHVTFFVAQWGTKDCKQRLQLGREWYHVRDRNEYSIRIRFNEDEPNRVKLNYRIVEFGFGICSR